MPCLAESVRGKRPTTSIGMAPAVITAAGSIEVHAEEGFGAEVTVALEGATEGVLVSEELPMRETSCPSASPRAGVIGSPP